MASERALLVAAGGGIGDTLLAGVVARALRTRYAAVDAVVLPAHVDLAAHVPSIERTIPFGARLTERYGAAVVTWATLGTALLPWRARIPVRVGQARRLYSPLFTHRVVVRSELGDRTTHWTDILLDYARAIGCDLADATPEFTVRDDERQTAETLLRVHDVRDIFSVLHPTRGLSAQRSRWPVEGFVALAKRLVARDGVPLLVTGSPDDAEIAHAIADGAGAGVTSVAGATSIGVFGALAERARAVVAMDSGPMHVAAAVGAPTVGVFALQSDEPDRWAPKGPRTAVVRPTYPCPPSHRKETCPDFACVRALDETAVLAALDGLLVTTAER
ncbi:MAG TPA: glycosyltransferase family 9 protein [Candidatus Elarobacter sp.]|jgi:heptosyltransferase-2|nr:glycosyltransferase family 9 protein [Candidatus Elarobacter sp.]